VNANKSEAICVFSRSNGRTLISGTKGSTSFQYQYNTDGLRTRKIVGSTTYDYYWQGSQLAAMTITNGNTVSTTMRFYYDAEGIPFYFTYNGTGYYYVTNLQGDVVGIANSNGVVGYYEYDAWGRIVSMDAASSMEYSALTYNPLRYRGYIYDNETEFYYLQTRYYDPAIRRFINADGVLSGIGLSGIHLFSYCHNNPVCEKQGNGYNLSDTQSAMIIENSKITIQEKHIISKQAQNNSNNNQSENSSKKQGLSLFIGFDTATLPNAPSWLRGKFTYVEFSVPFKFNYSNSERKISFNPTILETNVGILSFEVSTPDLLNNLDLDLRGNAKIQYFHANATLALSGIAANARILTGTVGAELDGYVAVSLEGFIGVGFTFDLSKGINIGGGLIVGGNINIEFDWSTLLTIWIFGIK